MISSITTALRHQCVSVPVSVKKALAPSPRYALVTLLSAATMLCIPKLGLSQTLFTWPDSRGDGSHYKYIELCLSVAERVEDSLDARSDTLFDTLPPPDNPGLKPVAVEIQAAVQRCLRRFPASTVPLTKRKLALRLYLLAGLDEEAAVLIARSIDTIPPTDSGQRNAERESAIGSYLSAKPIRLDAAQRLMDEWTGPTPTNGWASRIKMFGAMLRGSQRCGRTDMVRRYGQDILTLAERLKDSLTDPGDQYWFLRTVQQAKLALHHDMLMDSLRLSNAAYSNVFRAKVGFNTIVGRRFPEIQSDFVFPASAEGERFPRPGTLTLFVPIPGDQRDSRVEFARNIQILRLKQRFPALEIVLVATTTGAIIPLSPPSPAEEAALFNTMLREYYHLPATLLVFKRSFFRLPDPDRRVIKQAIDLEQVWPGVLATGGADAPVVLVDKTGTIAAMRGLRFEAEEKAFLETLQIIYDREFPQGQTSAR